MESIFKYFIKFFKTSNLEKMSAQIECPICMDCVEFTKNCVTTDCGHSFHASCLMQNVAHNGFGCPYCRAAMAEEPEEDENEDEDTWTGESYVAEEEVFDDDAMRGFRFFFNNLNGEAHDEEDVVEEENYLTESIEDNDAADPNIPAVNFVAQKLQEQGVTYDQLIKLILHRDHEEYDPEDAEVERFDNELFGKIRIIVSNYQPQPLPTEEPAVAPTPTIQTSEPVPRPTPMLDNEAQPKTRQVRNVPAFMPHV